MCRSKSEFGKKIGIQKFELKVSQVTEPKASSKKGMKRNKNLQKNPKKRRQHPKPNPALGTEMKPELKVNYILEKRMEIFL